MVITDIKKRKRKLNEIYVDGELFGEIDSYILGTSNLNVGSVVDEKTLKELAVKSDNYRAYSKAVYWLNFRDYSSVDLFNKLKPEFPEETILPVLERLKSLHFLDDNKFAQKYARMLIFEKRFSKRRAEFEMAKKGIDKSYIREIIDSIEVDEREQIRSLINKKYKEAFFEDGKIRRRAVSFLLRYGYGLDDINAVINSGENLI